MKKMFIILLATGNLIAMQTELPQSKKDCFAAYTEFEAMIKTCKHMGSDGSASVIKQWEVDKHQKCVQELFQSFLKKCITEKAQKPPKKTRWTIWII